MSSGTVADAPPEQGAAASGCGQETVQGSCGQDAVVADRACGQETVAAGENACGQAAAEDACGQGGADSSCGQGPSSGLKLLDAQEMGAWRAFLAASIGVTAALNRELEAGAGAAAQSGGKNVFLEEEPKVAAVGAGMNIFEPKGNMIIDIGGGTTDVAVLSLGGVVTAESVRVAGNGLDEAIIRYVKKEYNLLIGERTAERVKREIGTVLPSLKNESMSIRGRDLVTGLPKTIDINSEEVASAFEESVQEIVQTAKNVLEKTPPELSADVIDHGIFLTGGGALLHGLDELLSGELQVPVFIAEDPLNCVAIGTTRLLQRMK